MSSTPQIPGYQFDQRLLQHPLAELWRGRTGTGMEVVALVLSEAGAGDEVVRERLAQAGRGAALTPGRQETALWAANFSVDRPHAITQLIPGQSGAERLLDPLDGVLGNDEGSLRAVREHLSQYGASPPAGDPATSAYVDTAAIPSYVDQPPADQPTTEQPPAEQPATQGNDAAPKQRKIDVAREYRRKIGGWVYLVVVLLVLIVFSVTYSVGATIGAAVKDETTAAAPAAPVSPGPFPSPVLKAGIPRITTAPYKRPTGGAGLVGATYPAGADVQVVANAGLPFAFGWPRPPIASSIGESSTVVYRRVTTATARDRPMGTLVAQVAIHPCAGLTRCLADRESFDKEWTEVLKALPPATAKDGRTWLTAMTTDRYALTMTRAFLNGGQWWLAGVSVTGLPEERQQVEQVLNDIWRQTS